MAEERNLSLASAPAAAADEDATKAELQRRMDEARESISQTVTEIKETVMTQYQQVRETISDTFDWREQYKRRPVPFTAGAFGVGILLGYSVANALKSDRDETEFDAEESFDRIEQGFDQLQNEPRAYAAQAITGAAVSRASRGSAADVGPESRPLYSASYAPQPAAAEASVAEEPQGPGLVARFKETRAYDRLQGELSTLGERVVDELSKTAQTVVVPALLNKLKDLIGIDLSTQREVAQRSRLEHDTAKASAATSATVDNQAADAASANTPPGAASAHATGSGRA
jgi:hypothetical protein